MVFSTPSVQVQPRWLRPLDCDGPEKNHLIALGIVRFPLLPTEPTVQASVEVTIGSAGQPNLTEVDKLISPALKSQSIVFKYCM
jgi:hypothetical protein